MNNNQQSKAYAATCAPLTAERRAKAQAKAEQLKRAQAYPDPHRDEVMKRRRERELRRFGGRRIARKPVLRHGLKHHRF